MTESVPSELDQPAPAVPADFPVAPAPLATAAPAPVPVTPAPAPQIDEATIRAWLQANPQFIGAPTAAVPTTEEERLAAIEAYPWHYNAAGDRVAL
jgi:hypothetical protein